MKPFEVLKKVFLKWEMTKKNANQVNKIPIWGATLLMRH